MNINGYEFQVVFCAFILLGLASVALVVDYLKGMNEKLRERHIELMARHDVVVQQVEEDNTRLLRALAEQSKAFREMNQRSTVFNLVSAEKAPEIALEPVEEKHPPSIEAQPVLSAAGPVAVADPEPAAASIETAEKESGLPSNVIRIRLKSAEPEPQPEPAAKAEGNEPDFEKFLEELVHEFDATQESNAHPAETATAIPEKTPGLLQITAGTHPPSVLSQLLDRDDSFFGLVLSVGFNDYLNLDAIHGHTTSEELLHTVDALMGELAGETGFCSRPSDGEFVLIYPLLNGPEAQQKVASISERLWDYQLETLGTYTAVFSWGACEGKRQSLTTVLQTATENMIETKGTRSAPETSPKQRATA